MSSIYLSSGFLQKAVSFLKEYLSGFFFIWINNNYQTAFIVIAKRKIGRGNCLERVRGQER